MSITHANFLTQVRNYTEVDSNVLSDTLIDQFIRNTELDIAGKVEYDDLKAYKTSTTVASQRYVSMPDDFLYLRSVQITNSGSRVFLEKRDTSFISEFNPGDSTGTPKYYANFSYLKGPADMYTLYKQKYNEEIQQFAMQQMGQRKRGQYEDGEPRMPIPSISPNVKGVG